MNLLFDDASDEERAILDALYSVEGWPQDHGKDLGMLRQWKKVYPHLDMLEEAVKWAAWMTEHESKKKIKYRARFSNWLAKAEEYREGKARRAAFSHRGAEQEGHGDSVEARRDW